MLKELKQQQRYVKENTEINSKQVKLFENLRKLLDVKMQVGRNFSGMEREDMNNQEDENTGYNRLVIRE